MKRIGLIVLLGSFCLGLPAYAQKSGQDRSGVQTPPPSAPIPQAPPTPAASTKDRPAFTRAAGQSFNIDLDTLDNHFSQWIHKDVSSLSAMKANLKIPRLGGEAKYLPYFTVRVATADGYSGIRIQKNPAKPDEFEAQAYSYNTEKKATTVLGKYAFAVAVDKQLDIMLAWKDTQLTAWLFDQAVDIPLSGPVTSVLITSSTGEITGDVELGQ